MLCLELHPPSLFHPVTQGYFPHEVLLVYQAHSPALASHSPRLNPHVLCVPTVGPWEMGTSRNGAKALVPLGPAQGQVLADTPEKFAE